MYIYVAGSFQISELDTIVTFNMASRDLSDRNGVY